MVDSATEFDVLCHELRRKLAELQRDFPNADAIPDFTARVDAFCNSEVPTTSEARQTARQQQLKLIVAIQSVWNILNRTKLWS